ncbi:flagellar brake protein [Dickeya sp. CFBP 2040]|uniref:Flagellar brake protein YcgR n=2 Tax=Pectobacteriaceae TaxID=1903410 RepID=A0A5B8IBU1_9GAMM|nr:flagellar brake protein [Dickeya sp. CFBP 2040]QDX31992.1 flagellar brake protein [Dickeya poaceiphila]
MTVGMDVVDDNMKEQYARRNKMAICSTLRGLQKQDATIMVYHTHGQFISKILEVDSDEGEFLFDLGALERENSRALFAGELEFAAETAGAKVEFRSTISRIVEHDDLPAFCATVPDVLYYIQRRNFFRINSPAWPPMICRGELPDNTYFEFNLKDLSLGGLCMYTDDQTMISLFEPGMVLKNIDVDLASYGQFCLDLEFINHTTTKVVDSKGHVKQIERLSFKFPRLNAAQERGLQQVITELELDQNEKRKRLR